MKKISSVILGLSLSLQVGASSLCRNATNTIIYKTAANSAELLVTDILDGQRVLKNLDLTKHNISLTERTLLGFDIDGDEVTSTSAVKIRVTKKSNRSFSPSFMDVTNDLLGLETHYICETVEKIGSSL
jgi:hypothetical protein